MNKLKSIFNHLSNDDKETFVTEKQKYLYYAFYGKNIPVVDDPSFNSYDDVVKIVPYLNEIDIRKVTKNIDIK